MESDEWDSLPALLELPVMGNLGFWTSDFSGTEDPCGNSSTRGKNYHWCDEIGPKDTASKNTQSLINALN